jgi:hypothetical protein
MKDERIERVNKEALKIDFLIFVPINTKTKIARKNKTTDISFL